MSGHTPGPWKVEHDYKPFVIHTADHIVCAISGTAATVPEAAANAALIAAAPETAAERDRLLEVNKELLAALKDLLTFDLVERSALRSKPLGAPNSTMRIGQEKLIALEDRARAAIARAEGTQP
jgi:hypothetical protein